MNFLVMLQFWMILKINLQPVSGSCLCLNFAAGRRFEFGLLAEDESDYLPFAKRRFGGETFLTVVKFRSL